MIDRPLADHPGKGLISKRKDFRETSDQLNPFAGMRYPFLGSADHNPRRLTTKENPTAVGQGNGIDPPSASYIQNPMAFSKFDRPEGFCGHALEDKFCVERENRRQDILVIPIQVPFPRKGLGRIPFLSDRRNSQVAGSLSAKRAFSFWLAAADRWRAKANSTMLPIKSL